jgi:hypothetical protein
MKLSELTYKKLRRLEDSYFQLQPRASFGKYVTELLSLELEEEERKELFRQKQPDAFVWILCRIATASIN